MQIGKQEYKAEKVQLCLTSSQVVQTLQIQSIGLFKSANDSVISVIPDVWPVEATPDEQEEYQSSLAI
jgi:hypothetical protein